MEWRAGEEEARLLLDAADPSSSRRETLGLEVETGEKHSTHAAARRALQASHFLSTWGQRGWEFAVGLIMLELHPSSLAFVALWGLLDSALSVACGAAVGAYVDSNSRLQAASRMYMMQNSCVVLSAATALSLLWSSVRSGAAYWAGLALTMAAGSVSTLGALGSTLSVEREWTKSLCGSDNAALASLNAAMKRIDLTCLIASPIMFGLVLQFAGGPPMVAATMVLLAWNLISWLPEVALLRYAQRQSPALAAEQARPKPPLGRSEDGTAAAAAAGSSRSSGGNDGLVVATAAAASSSSSSSRGGNDGLAAATAAAASSSSSSRGGLLRRVGAPLRRQARAWVLYVRQPAAAAALALALLYLTVLSWGTLMTAYLKAMGLPEAELAVYRGLGALSGIAATLLFPLLHRRLGLVPSAALAIWMQLACLLCGTLPAVVAGLGAAAVPPHARTYALVWGLVLSRFGLWSYDLAVNQLIQETAEHGTLGTINGVQGSLQSLFQMLAYLAGVLGPSTEQFVGLMAGSCCVVGVAAALATAFALRSGCGRRLGGAALEPVGNGRGSSG